LSRKRGDDNDAVDEVGAGEDGFNISRKGEFAVKLLGSGGFCLFLLMLSIGSLAGRVKGPFAAAKSRPVLSIPKLS
jgi:hypothetical protein